MACGVLYVTAWVDSPYLKDSSGAKVLMWVARIARAILVEMMHATEFLSGTSAADSDEALLSFAPTGCGDVWGSVTLEE